MVGFDYNTSFPEVCPCVDYLTKCTVRGNRASLPFATRCAHCSSI